MSKIEDWLGGPRHTKSYSMAKKYPAFLLATEPWLRLISNFCERTGTLEACPFERLRLVGKEAFRIVSAASQNVCMYGLNVWDQNALRPLVSMPRLSQAAEELEHDSDTVVPSKLRAQWFGVHGHGRRHIHNQEGLCC